jgi:hypothetical protein
MILEYESEKCKVLWPRVLVYYMDNKQNIQWNLSNPTHQGTRKMYRNVQDIGILRFYFSEQKYFGTINFGQMSQDVGTLRCQIAQVLLYIEYFTNMCLTCVCALSECITSTFIPSCIYTNMYLTCVCALSECITSTFIPSYIYTNMYLTCVCALSECITSTFIPSYIYTTMYLTCVCALSECITSTFIPSYINSLNNSWALSLDWTNTKIGGCIPWKIYIILTGVLKMLIYKQKYCLKIYVLNIWFYPFNVSFICT